MGFSSLTKEEMCIETGSSIKSAIEKINANGHGVIFVTNGDLLLGAVTDGDFRRGILKDAQLDYPVDTIMNVNLITLPEGAGAEETYGVIAKGISQGKKVFPRVDESGVLSGFSFQNDWGIIPIAEPDLSGNEAAYLMQCVEQNWISSTGPFVSKFENDFASYTKLSNPVAVSNGTVALTLALQALKLPQGAEVIVPSETFAATANAVIAAGGVPVLADIDPITWALSVETVKPLINKNTKAIILVHLYGSPGDVIGLRELADNFSLFLVEDCAEAIGTTAGGHHVGYWSDAASFSFFGNKTLTTGEGGMVFFSDKSVADRARQLRAHGMSISKRYWHDVVGYNYRMTNLQAAIGVAQIERANQLVDQKKLIGEKYKSLLKDVAGVSLMPTSPFGDSTYWLVAVLLDEELANQRIFIMEQMALSGIQSRTTFPAMHLMPPFQEYPKANSLSISEDVQDRGICLPNTPYMTTKSVEQVVDALDKAISLTKSKIGI